MKPARKSRTYNGIHLLPVQIDALRWLNAVGINPIYHATKYPLGVTENTIQTLAGKGLVRVDEICTMVGSTEVARITDSGCDWLDVWYATHGG